MSISRKAIGHIHRIREFELEKINLADEFDILQIVGEGWFGKILLVEHKATDTEMVLKALPKPYVSLRDFYREFHYGIHLGTHKNIVSAYDVAFETAGFYVFTQEYAPLGDLTSNVDTGIGELHTKRVAKQIAAALDFMHAKDLVHRDVKLDNVLVFRSDFSRVKLCDFGESRKSGSLVQRRNEWLPYSPPEVLSVHTDSDYVTDPCHDTWQFGIVVFVCLTGCLPWQKAAADDPRYVRYAAWHNTTLGIPIKRQPKLFKLVTAKASKMFRRFLDPRPERRPKTLGELLKFTDDRWLSKGAEKELVADEPDELSPSMYSFHSNADEKNQLLSSLTQYGIEATVDRFEKRNRIRQWIQSSVIAEEEEEDDSGTTTPTSTVSRTPISGHVSSVRAREQDEQQSQKINTTIKDASNKHFDPRTGLVQAGPSEMGVTSPLGSGRRGRAKSPRPGPMLRDASTETATATTHASMSPSTSIEETTVDAHLDIALNGNAASQNYTENYNYKVKTNESSQTTENGNTKGPLKTKSSFFGSADLIKSSNFKQLGRTSTSKGLISAFQSLTSITVPEVYSSNSPRDQIIASTNKDSGYGSMDKIRTALEQKTSNSPVLVKRSSIKLSPEINCQQEDEPFNHTINSGRDTINGFSNFLPDSSGTSTMKDSPYDQIQVKKK